MQTPPRWRRVRGQGPGAGAPHADRSGASAGAAKAHAWASRNGSPRSSANAKATVIDVEKGSPSPSVTGARAFGRASARLATARDRAASSAARWSAGAREVACARLGESAGASRERLGQLATGALRRRAGSELRQRRVENVQKQSALPQASCEQNRQHRDAQQEPCSQLAEVPSQREALVVSDGSQRERFHPDRPQGAMRRACDRARATAGSWAARLAARASRASP